METAETITQKKNKSEIPFTICDVKYKYKTNSMQYSSICVLIRLIQTAKHQPAQ